MVIKLKKCECARYVINLCKVYFFNLWHENHFDLISKPQEEVIIKINKWVSDSTRVLVKYVNKMNIVCLISVRDR